MTSQAIAPSALRPKDAAAYIGLSERTIYKLIERKELKPRKVGRSTLLRVSDLLEWLNKQVA